MVVHTYNSITGKAEAGESCFKPDWTTYESETSLSYTVVSYLKRKKWRGGGEKKTEKKREREEEKEGERW